MKFFLWLYLFLMPIATYAANDINEVFNDFINNPEIEKIEFIWEKLNESTPTQVLEILNNIDQHSTAEKVFIAGILWRYEKFPQLFEKCLQDGSDVKRAVCIVADLEWQSAQEKGLSEEILAKAVKLSKSPNQEARSLIAPPLTVSRYYTPQLFNDILFSLSLKNSTPIDDMFHELNRLMLDSITSSNTEPMNELDAKAFYINWLKVNSTRLKPTAFEISNGQLIVKNPLYRYALTLPLDYIKQSDAKAKNSSLNFMNMSNGITVAIRSYAKNEETISLFKNEIEKIKLILFLIKKIKTQ